MLFRHLWATNYTIANNGTIFHIFLFLIIIICVVQHFQCNSNKHFNGYEAGMCLRIVIECCHTEDSTLQWMSKKFAYLNKLFCLAWVSYSNNLVSVL